MGEKCFIKIGDITLEGSMVSLDSTAHAPRVTSPHVHERPEDHPSRGTAGDEAAGHGEHEGHHR